MSWQWDPSLFAGAAAYYARGRIGYPPELVAALREELGLDGTTRLLDVGCGPGALTLLLAPHVGQAVGIDADADMIREAEARAPANARFVHLRAEELPAGLGTFHAVTFAQSLHWLDQELVARRAHGLLEPGGALVWIGATTDRGEGDVPHEEIADLVRSYLGPGRRAGRGSLAEGRLEIEEEPFLRAGFRGPRRGDGPGGRGHERTVDDLVAAVFSRSFSAPHLFGDRLDEFERRLRLLLRDASPPGRFSERLGGAGLTIWQR